MNFYLYFARFFPKVGLAQPFPKVGFPCFAEKSDLAQPFPKVDFHKGVFL